MPEAEERCGAVVDNTAGRQGAEDTVFPPLLATDGRTHKGDCEMQTGAIFARGSCSALKWMALFGVVFALGTGSAVAQPVMTLSVPDKYELTKGGSLTVTIKASIARAAGAAATSVTVAVEGDNDTTAPPDDAEPAQDVTISPGVVTLTGRPWAQEHPGAQSRRVTCRSTAA